MFAKISLNTVIVKKITMFCGFSLTSLIFNYFYTILYCVTTLVKPLNTLENDIIRKAILWILRFCAYKSGSTNKYYIPSSWCPFNIPFIWVKAKVRSGKLE